jgi:iron(III) transport system substrate-binding protein
MLLAGAVAPLVSAAYAEPSANWKTVIELAKKEGSLTVYTGALGQTSHGKVAKAFEKQYGISVRFFEGRASEIRERLRAEQSAGRFLADVSHDGSTTSSLQVHDNVFEAFGPLPNLSRLRAPFVATDMLIPVSAIAYSIMVNTRLVKPSEEPHSWTDLTDPKWKGKILSDDMRALGGGGVMFAVLQENLGQGFHDKLALNQPVFTRDIRASEQRVARGEYPIWIPLSTNDILLMKGLPIKMIAPSEGMPYIAYDLGLLRNAPHPNAARLFMDFFLSQDAQVICAEEGLITTTSVELPARVAGDVSALRDVKLLGTTDPSRIDEMLKLASGIYHS